MKTISAVFSNRKTLILLATNWITMIVLTVYFLGEANDISYKVVGTLILGFILQLSFFADQIKRKSKK